MRTILAPAVGFEPTTWRLTAAQPASQKSPFDIHRDRHGTRGTAPARSWRLTPTGYASEDPTTRAAWMVQGETDAGPQRRCVACRQWWPLEKDHWVRRPRAKGRTGYIQPCKACRVENGMADS